MKVWWCYSRVSKNKERRSSNNMDGRTHPDHIFTTIVVVVWGMIWWCFCSSNFWTMWNNSIMTIHYSVVKLYIYIGNIVLKPNYCKCCINIIESIPTLIVNIINFTIVEKKKLLFTILFFVIILYIYYWLSTS